MCQVLQRVIPGRRSEAKAKLLIGCPDSEFAAEPVIGPAKGRTRWRRPGMTPKGCAHRVSSI
jgi:hypothetical protein